MKILFLIIVLHILPNTGVSETLLEQWKIERSEQTVSTKGIKTIEIINLFGNARTRSSTNSELTVLSVFQRHKKDNQKPLIKVNRIGKTLRIEVSYRENKQLKNIPDAEKRRIDMSFLVPKKTRLSIKTDKGFAEVKGHTAFTSIKTKSGGVYVKTKNQVEVQTDSGKIYATFKQKTWKNTSKLKSYTGDIEVAMLGDPNVSINVETAGQITTDYSINIDPAPGSKIKYAVAQIGHGSNDEKGILVKSKLGNIRLYRMIEMINSK